jgi:hypothetical protein
MYVCPACLEMLGDDDEEEESEIIEDAVVLEFLTRLRNI